MLWLFLMSTLPFPEQSDIRLERHEGSGRTNLVFFAPHENESVANDYLAAAVKEKGGVFFILRQRGERHLFLTFPEGSFEVDPNRIFTDAGAKSSVARQNPGLADRPELYAKVWKRAAAIGRFILDQFELTPQTVIVAIHNNTDGYDDDGKGGVGTVSIERYWKKKEAGAKFIKDVHRGKGDEDDLFFITSPKDFAAMKRDGWHVILQHPQVAILPDEDDGSLSVYAEMKGGMRYINIEAQRNPDHLDVQRRMVDYIFKLVKP